LRLGVRRVRAWAPLESREPRILQRTVNIGNSLLRCSVRVQRVNRFGFRATCPAAETESDAPLATHHLTYRSPNP
jgi:hypothetical protein